MNEQYSLLFLKNAAETIGYQTQGFGPTYRIPERDRQTQGERLLSLFDDIWAEVTNNNESRAAIGLPVRNGTYLEFKSAPDHDLITKSLEFRGKIKLLNIRELEVDGSKETYATVYIPAGKENYFIKKIRKYLTELDKRSNQPKNNSFVNSIEDIKIALLASFWTDPLQLLPDQDTSTYCELWLKTNPGKEEETLGQAFAVCEFLSIEVVPKRFLYFPERTVCLIRANRDQLTELIESFEDIAEIRLAKQTASFWVNEPNAAQAEWSDELLNRLTVKDTNIGVCLLDTGINNGHPLIGPVLSNNDLGAYDAAWGTNDHNGHGTLMGGVSAYGDLESALQSTDPITITHRLSSVKILPPRGANDPDLYGSITQQAISIAEINSPKRNNLFCCAVTSTEIDHKGRPSSWSSAIDSITSGQVDDIRRLFIVSGGNVSSLSEWEGYPNTNILNSIHDPAQSWNSLTIGAYTEKVTIHDPNMAGHIGLAPLRGLSPYSSCSTMWGPKWPLKPEVVLEGGNLRKAPDGSLYENHPDLSILSTSHDITNTHFDTIFATSAASAKGAWLAAKIQAAYPNIWPETLKALIVHSAEWPDSIIQQFGIDVTQKKDIYQLMRICGYGVPDLNRAVNCASNYLTMVAEETIQPFTLSADKRGVMKDMHVYDLPWPKEELLNLGALPVKLKITLCYFVEPGPGEIGWKDKYRYASHGLRFDVNNVNDTKEEFIKRINLASREENETSNGNSGSERWLMGANNRVMGSLHSDTWEGTAADIATCNYIGVYPVLGWWRERKHLGNVEKQARYSLIVSLVTPEQEINIYTPIETIIKTPIPISRQ